MRLRQWSRVAAGPQDWTGVFTGPIDSLWQLADCEPPEWAGRTASRRQQRTAARDLIGSVQRFNQRWLQFLRLAQPRADQPGNRPVQRVLCARKGVRDGLGAAGRAALHAGAPAVAGESAGTLSDAARARASHPMRLGRGRLRAIAIQCLAVSSSRSRVLHVDVTIPVRRPRSSRFRPSPIGRRGGSLLAWPGRRGIAGPASPGPDRDEAGADKEAAADRPASTASGPAFEVDYPSTLGDRPITARVYVMLEPGTSRAEPRLGPELVPSPAVLLPARSRTGSRGRPCASTRRRSASPGRSRPSSRGNTAPRRSSGSTPTRTASAPARGTPTARWFTSSSARRRPGRSSWRSTKVVPPRKFQETDRIKLAELDSPLLSAFHHGPSSIARR